MKTLEEVRKEHPTLRLDGVEILDVNDNVSETLVVRGMTMATAQFVADMQDSVKVIDLVKLCLVHPTAEIATAIFNDNPLVVQELAEMVNELSRAGYRSKKKKLTSEA